MMTDKQCKKCDGAMVYGINGYGGKVCMCHYQAAPTPPNTITIPVDEYAQLKKDAERYRWLRENYKFADGIWAVVACQQNKHLVDDAVDQAMEGKS